MTIGRWFVGGLWLFGLVSGLAVATTPALRDLPVPSLTWPLVFALLIEIAVLPLARAGRVAPITMNERALAVIGGALIHTLVIAALPAS